MKRQRPWAAKRATAKKRRTMSTAGQYVAPSAYTVRQIAGRPYRAPFVPRTPGGQIVADNHYFDTERTTTALPAPSTAWTATELDPNTSAMLCLFAPTVGDDISNRTGRKVFVKKIRIRGTINCPAQSAQATCDEAPKTRLIVYMDKQTNAAQSQGEDLIASGAANDAINMFQNISNLNRFKVYKDKTIILQNPAVLGPTTGSLVAQNGLVRDFKFNIKVNEWVNYNATNGGTVADVIDKSFHLIGGQTGTLPLTISYKVRTVFLP